MQPVIPFEPSKWDRFTNPFEATRDTNEILAILANIRSYLQTNSVSAMKNTLLALKRNVQDLVNTTSDPDVVTAGNTVLSVFTAQGL